MDTKKILMSIGAAIATSKLARTITAVELDDVLGTVGLARRRSCALENLALVGAGAVIGAGAALLFAPTSGREARQRIGDEATRLGQVAKDAIRERKDEAMRTIAEVAGSGTAAQHG
ncbi:MAG: YtxH domain-containing protein [Polyangiaceae bacterium]